MRYKKKMHGTINYYYLKVKFISKNILCVLILFKYELYELLYTEIFQIYSMWYANQK